VFEQADHNHQTACRRWHDLVRQKVLGAA
jgi:hypothetical protein